MPRARCRAALSVYLALSGALCGWGAPAAQAEADLKIVVLEGEDGINVIKKKTAVRPVVEVRDRNNSPVSGAVVVFLLPQQGAGGNFITGGKMMTVTTDSAGRATAGAFQPSGAGQFKINVTASHQGRSVSTAIQQTNQIGAAAGLSGGAIAAIVGVVAGAAVGLAVGLSGGNGDQPSTPVDNTPRATIGVGGSPVFSGPR